MRMVCICYHDKLKCFFGIHHGVVAIFVVIFTTIPLPTPCCTYPHHLRELVISPTVCRRQHTISHTKYASATQNTNYSRITAAGLHLCPVHGLPGTPCDRTCHIPSIVPHRDHLHRTRHCDSFPCTSSLSCHIHCPDRSISRRCTVHIAGRGSSMCLMGRLCSHHTQFREPPLYTYR